MRRQDIHIGSEYDARVSGRVVRVTVLEYVDDRHRPWRCRNTATGKEVMKSSAQLRPLPGSEAEKKHKERLEREYARARHRVPAACHEEIIGQALLGAISKEEATDRASLLSAVQIAITCSACGGVLDCRSAVYIERRCDEKPLRIVCAACGHRAVEELERRHGADQVRKVLHIVDGSCFNWASALETL